MKALSTTAAASQVEDRIVVYGSLGRPRERVDRFLLGQSMILGADFNTFHTTVDRARLSLTLGDLSDRDFEIVLSQNFQQLRENRKLQAKAKVLKAFYCDQRIIRGLCNLVVKMIKAKGRSYSPEDALIISRYWSWIASSPNRVTLVSENDQKLKRFYLTIPIIAIEIFIQMQNQFMRIPPVRPKKEEVRAFIQEFQNRVTKRFAAMLQRLQLERSIANDYLLLLLDIISETSIKFAVNGIMQKHVDLYDKTDDSFEKIELENFPKALALNKENIELSEALLKLEKNQTTRQMLTDTIANCKKTIEFLEARLKELRERRVPETGYADVLLQLNAFDQLLLGINQPAPVQSVELQAEQLHATMANDLFERIDAFSQLTIQSNN